MEETAAHLGAAFDKLAANKEASGTDRQTIEHVRKHLPAVRRT